MVALLKLLGEYGLVGVHTAVELVFRYVHIVNLDVEIPPSRETVLFIHYEVFYADRFGSDEKDNFE